MKKEKLLDLLNEMTLEEKIYQLVQLSGEFFNSDDMAIGPKQELGITQEVVDNVGTIYNVFGAENLKKIQDEYMKKNRLNIPLVFMADIIYGYKTIFPVPLALGCSWNPELVEKSMKVVAEESAVSGIHVTFSPMVDLVRDPRWGRVIESTGEDTYLNSIFSSAMVKGFQNNMEPDKSIVSCVKHFAAYGAAEGGRDYNTVDMSERRLRQDYLPSYKAAVDSGCGMVMTSFNTVDGIPATGNKWLLRQVLREEWGFNGVVVSDYAAIKELIDHGVAENEEEAAQLAIEAGVDFDMKTGVYANNLKSLVEKGIIKEDIINEAVLRILELKNNLGLFENPYRGADEIKEKLILCSENNRKLARETAGKSMVLLKNDNKVLPLKKEQKVALIGPYADSKMLLGMWAFTGDSTSVVSLKEGLENKVGAKINYAKGVDILEDYSILGSMAKFIGAEQQEDFNSEAAMKQALETAANSDVIVLALGEHMLQSAEGGSRADLSLPKHQIELMDKLKETGKELVLVIFAGRPLILTDIQHKADAIIQAWFPGSEGGNALADIIYGDVNPSGKLAMSFPYSVGQIPVYYNHFSTGRPERPSDNGSRFRSRYLDIPNSPLYPFGYGLSYTEFEYSDVKLSKDKLTDNETIKASVIVTNVGEVKGEETVQLYLQDVKGSVVRPVKELKGFKKVVLEPKESKEVFFDINVEMLKFFTGSMEFKAEPGRFKVYIGKNSAEVHEAEFIYQ